MKRADLKVPRPTGEYLTQVLRFRMTAESKGKYKLRLFVPNTSVFILVLSDVGM